jgi:hypothetical protein
VSGRRYIMRAVDTIKKSGDIRTKCVGKKKFGLHGNSPSDDLTIMLKHKGCFEISGARSGLTFPKGDGEERHGDAW